MKKNDVLVRFAMLQSVCNKRGKNGSCLESGCLCREEKCPVVFLRVQDLGSYSDLREISDFAKEVYDLLFDYYLGEDESEAVIEKQRRENIQRSYNLVLKDLNAVNVILKKYCND